MEIKKFIMGELASNAYLVSDGEEAALFDIGSDNLEELKTYLDKNNLKLKKLILTHGHIDHIKGLEKLNETYPEIEIYIGNEDQVFLSDPTLNLSKFVYFKEISFHLNDKIKTLSEGDIVFGFRVMSTPGHTIGSKVFYNEKQNWLITGDTLFKGSLGRTDFPTGNYESMIKSLEKIFSNFSGETIIFPGHGEETTLIQEKNGFDFY